MGTWQLVKAFWYHYITSQCVPDIIIRDEYIIVRTGPVYSCKVE